MPPEITEEAEDQTTNNIPEAEEVIAGEEIDDGGFSSGFKSVSGSDLEHEEETIIEPEIKAEEETPEEVKPEKEVEPVLTEVEQLKKDKRRLEGKVGELMMNKPAAIPDKAPEKKPLPRLKGQDKLSETVQELPELASIEDVTSELHQKIIDQDLALQNVQANYKRDMEEAKNTIAFEMRHPDFLEVTSEDDFTDWSLKGGPNKADYLEMKGLEKSAEDERFSSEQRTSFNQRANNMLDSWEQIHPQWWEDKGLGLFSESAKPAIALLDDYKSHKQQILNTRDLKSSAQKRRTDRITNAVTPRGKGVSQPTTVSDEQAFSNGFKKTFG